MRRCRTVDGDKKSSLAVCENTCSSTPGCVAMEVHWKDGHCHTYMGALTAAQYASDLEADDKYETCRKL